MKKFSIDVRASGKKEMKKARKYLRGKGLSVRKRSEAKKLGFGLNYLTSYLPLESEPQNDFNYLGGCNSAELTLTLPQDWDKLVEIVEEKEGAACNSFIHHMDVLRYGIIGCQASRPWAPKLPSGGIISNRQPIPSSTVRERLNNSVLRSENKKLKAKLTTARKNLSDIQNEH